MASLTAASLGLSCDRGGSEAEAHRVPTERVSMPGSQRWGANYFTAEVSAFIKSTKQNELIPQHKRWLIFKQLGPLQGKQTRGTFHQDVLQQNQL